MKIAIHHRNNSFSQKWIEYCQSENIEFKIVNCYDSDVIAQIKDCDGFMWHFHHASSKDVLFAKQLIYAIEATGKKVFPNFNTVWHFDDKIGQKYLLESFNIPMVPSYVFYSKKQALEWIKQAVFPMVCKLRSGAGSRNVHLLKTKREAQHYVMKMFNKGIRNNDPWNGNILDCWRNYRTGKLSFLHFVKSIGRLVIKTDFEKIVGKQRGYVYFQKFIEGCSFDIRVKIVDNKCWAFRRLVRKNDFRASGSNKLILSTDGIPIETIKIAFDIYRKLKLQCVAFDFVLTKDNRPLLIEMSYGFGYDIGENYGYWDLELNRHEGMFNPFGWMVESIIR